jgi:hypothetical protein
MLKYPSQGKSVGWEILIFIECRLAPELGKINYLENVILAKDLTLKKSESKLGFRLYEFILLSNVKNRIFRSKHKKALLIYWLG